MSDQAGLINGKRSANREQQTLPGGLRTPAEKDVLFFQGSGSFWCCIRRDTGRVLLEVLGAGEGPAVSRATR